MTHRLKPYYLVSVLLPLFFFLLPATAWTWGGPAPDPSTLIDQFDQDGDGRLSAGEFKGPADHFSRMDADGDGYLTQAELENGPPAPTAGENPFDRDDADGDGMVSADEFNGPADMFDRMDTDGDGYITQNEIPPRKGMEGSGPTEQTDENQ